MAGKIDWDAVRVLMEDGVTQAEVCRRFGVHQNTVRAHVRLFDRKCVRCGKPLPHGRNKTNCADCASWDAERVKARRRERRLAGVCQLCDERLSPLSRAFCDTHRIADIQWRRERAEKRRGVANGGVSSPKQKRYNVRRRYGDGAWAVYQRANGQCQACGVADETAVVQMHHIDEDQSNNGESNFAALCFRCHQTTHFLLRCADLGGFLKWFGQTYPDRLK